MCGRFTIITKLEELESRFHAKAAEQFRPNYNAAPTQNLPVITNDAPDKIQTFRWGLIPSWAKDAKIGYKLINARAEGVAEKPSYRTPFKTKRCLVLADGFYEWKKTGTTKTPYRICMKDGTPFAMAGLWETWKENDKAIHSFTIITGEPNSLVKNIHDRMAIILAQKDEQKWLTCTPEEALKLLQPYPANKMTAYPVSTKVNSPKNNTPDVTNPIEQN